MSTYHVQCNFCKINGFIYFVLAVLIFSKFQLHISHVLVYFTWFEHEFSTVRAEAISTRANVSVVHRNKWSEDRKCKDVLTCLCGNWIKKMNNNNIRYFDKRHPFIHSFEIKSYKGRGRQSEGPHVTMTYDLWPFPISPSRFLTTTC